MNMIKASSCLSVYTLSFDQHQSLSHATRSSSQSQDVLWCDAGNIPVQDIIISQQTHNEFIRALYTRWVPPRQIRNKIDSRTWMTMFVSSNDFQKEIKKFPWDVNSFT